MSLHQFSDTYQFPVGGGGVFSVSDIRIVNIRNKIIYKKLELRSKMKKQINR